MKWSSLFHCEPEVGLLTWKVRPREMFQTDLSCTVWNRRYAGRVAGHLNKRGYRLIQIGRRGYRAHRIIWEMVHGTIPDGQEIDHINGIRDDNRITNLRLTSHAENMRNSRQRRDCPEGHTGVYARKDKWRAMIRHDGRLRHLGTFSSREAAAAAYQEAAARLGFHPNQGRAFGRAPGRRARDRRCGGSEVRRGHARRTGGSSPSLLPCWTYPGAAASGVFHGGGMAKNQTREHDMKDTTPTLFEGELLQYWEEHWWGMPEFSHEDLSPIRQLIVSFATQEEVDQFEESIGQKITPNTRSVWFTPQQIGTYQDKSYE